MLTLLSILTGPALALDLCEPPALGAGSLFAVQVTDAPPGARVWFVRGDQIGGPTCPAALNGSCVDVTSPRVIGSAIARADGSVELRGAVPAGVPA
ncbi:MAG TPA: hypothetical protein PKA64_19370, partial [Myxococcota bacterium]|nr:hypothetical protein [Myxococcota bacterium]